MVSSPETAQPAPAPRPSLARRTSPLRLFVDRIARWGVTAGGMTVILGVLGILVFILVEVAPLLRRARVSPAGVAAVAGPPLRAIVADEYRTHLVGLGDDGAVRSIRLDDGAASIGASVLDSATGRVVRIEPVPGSSVLTASTSLGWVVVVPVLFETSFRGQDRRIEPRVQVVIPLDADPSRKPVAVFAARHDTEAGTTTAAALLADGSLAVVRRDATRNPITEQETVTSSRHTIVAPPGLTHLVLDSDQKNLYGGASDGRLFWWTLDDGAPRGPARSVEAGPAAVTAMSLLVGDRSLVVGQADGSLSVWFRIRRDDQTLDLSKIREFPRLPGAVRMIAPSSRDKGFLAQDESGQIGLYYSTSHRVMWRGASPVHDATALVYTQKADGAYVAGPGRVGGLRIRNSHPETSIEALFAGIWYEGYDEPAFVWQSTGGTDDFESKLSLTPLVFGTLKGTFFSLILAIPLGVLGAMYASQFMHPTLRRFVKPTVEIMAALPSVVLGFLAGLWLAPRLETVFPGLMLMVPVLTILVLAAGRLFSLLPRSVRGRLPAGIEVSLYIVALVAGISLCLRLSGPIESLLFAGNFQDWLRHTTGLAYDQRNAVVVGLAMGFAVIPIIFAIAEDAFSNVPTNLVSGSLALGANRWQTVTRVVLPTASPGIFSAIMVGFGRAVGETMIVLMATGNTPILDWNPFNGFRTLSANIAVEIPEAPQGGTLYRTLFLAALLLFVVTFLVNTVAELVRQRLRRRYAAL